MSAQTRPPTSTQTDWDRWQREKTAHEEEARLRGEVSKFGQRINHSDGRVTAIVNWFAGIGIVLVSASMIWMMSTTSSTEKAVAILLDRPVPVSKAQYDTDRQETLSAIHALQADVKDIQFKQAQTLNRQARP